MGEVAPAAGGAAGLPDRAGFDSYEFERMRVAAAAASDFVFVNLFRDPIGAPLRPDAVGELLAAASRRAGLDPAIRPHQLRHACGSNLADAGGGIDVVADLLGHASVSSSQVYVHVTEDAELRAVADWKALTTGWRAALDGDGQIGSC